jgi:hypothetical protein
VINPKLALRVEGEWRNIYQLLRLEWLGATHREEMSELPIEYLRRWEQLDAQSLAEFRRHLLAMTKENQA